MAVRGRDRSPALTPTAFEQLRRRLGVPAHYAARLDPSMAVRLLNYERHRQRVDEFEDPVLLRCYGNLVRGVLSDHYVPLDDTLALATVGDALGGRQARVHHFWGGHDGFELRLVFDDQRLPLHQTRRVGDVVSPGLYLRNSEAGVGCLALKCFILRLVCKNGLVVAQDQTFYRCPHIAVEPGRAVAELRRAVNQVADQAVGAARLLGQAAERGLRGGARGALGVLARREKLSRELTEALLRAYDGDGHDNLFGVVNAVTAVARRWPDQVRTRLEVLGGELLRWPERYGVEAA